MGEEIHLGHHPAPTEIHGSLAPGPSKVWLSHLSMRERGILVPREWQQVIALRFDCKATVPSKQAWVGRMPRHR